MFDEYFVKVVRASDKAIIPIPNEYISLTSYVSTPHQRQDLDSFQDNLGHLHRNVLTHTRSKLEFNTPPLTEKKLQSLQNIINSAIINTNERKGEIIHYCFDTHTYERGTFYIPDITFTPLLIRPNGEVLMDKVRFAFIEY